MYFTWETYTGGHGNLLQYPCLENPMDGGDWQAAVHGTSKSWTPLTIHTHTHTHIHTHTHTHTHTYTHTHILVRGTDDKQVNKNIINLRY